MKKEDKNMNIPFTERVTFGEVIIEYNDLYKKGKKQVPIYFYSVQISSTSSNLKDNLKQLNYS